MLMKGIDLEEKPDIPSTHADHWKQFQPMVIGKENELKQSLIEFNYYQKIDDKVWKHIEDIMHESELDLKIIKYQTNPASAMITWANASFQLLKALRAVPEDKLKDMETLNLSQKKGYKLYYFDLMGRAESTRCLLWKWGVPYEDKRLTREEWAELKEELEPEGHTGMPILELPDGKKLSQSAAIMNYIATMADLHPKDPKDQFKGEILFECFIRDGTKIWTL